MHGKEIRKCSKILSNVAKGKRITMDKMRMESLDFTTQNLEKIGNIFPNCITETVDENGRPKKAIN